MKNFLFFSFLITTQSISAGIQDSLARYYKCSALLLERYPKSDDKKVKLIKEEKLNGTEACKALYQDLHFNKEGLLTPATSRSLKVFSSFQKFYNSWIKLKNLNFETQDFSNTDYYDINEGPYHLTYSLFSKEHFGEIFKGNTFYKAKRKSSSDKRYFFDRDIHGFRFEVDTPFNKWKIGSEDSDEYGQQGPNRFFDRPQLAEVGQLIGIRKMHSYTNKIFYRDTDISFYPNKPKGAGVIGTNPYLIANSSSLNRKVMGLFDYDRRWATSVFRDYLCLELPLLSENDVLKYIDKESSTSFLTDPKCMQCHVTMDFMGATLRNIERYNTGDDDGNFSIVASYTHSVEERKRFKEELPTHYAKLFKTSPDGILYFRDIKGNLIKEKVENLEQLGQKISQTDAPYYCAVKRHFEYFTNYNVPMNAFFQFYQNNTKDPLIRYLVKLSEELKEKGNLKKMITRIIASPYFLEKK